MKNVLISTAVIAATLVSTGAAYSFNNADFNGNYAFRLNGPATLVSSQSVQTVAVGQLSADGAGHVQGTGSFYSQGVQCLAEIVGSYKINQDGTGTLYSNMYPLVPTPGCMTNNPIDLAIVLTNNDTSLYAMSIQQHALVGKLVLQNKINYRQGDLHGSYALHLSGSSTLFSQGQAKRTTAIGVLVADGHGSVTGQGTVTSAGITCSGVIKNGSYQVNSNGTGTIKARFISTTPGCAVNNPVHLALALYDNGQGMEGGMLVNQDGDSLLGSFDR
jgi:hypothetical protein